MDSNCVLCLVNVTTCLFSTPQQDVQLLRNTTKRGFTLTNEQLQVEFSSRRFHLLAFADPLVLSKLRIKGTFLQPLHLEREARTQLLQTCTGFVALLAVNIAVVAHEYEITLVVKGHHLATFELRLL